MFAASRRLPTLRAWARGALVWLATLSYVATVSGVPLPVPPEAKPGGAFPCQHGRCGCSSAGQCWSNCCCHTPRERQAWAKRHGVVPPVDLEALARQADRKLAAQPKRVKANADCCASETGSQPKKASCHAASNRQSRGVVAIEALRCRGNSTLWVTSGAVTAPPPLFEHRVTLLLTVERIASFDQRLFSPAYVPDDPPPRCG